MGLTVDVYRSGFPDCTNNGISAFNQSLVLVNVKGPSQPDTLRPAAMLVPNHFNSARIVPAIWADIGEWIEAPGWWMMGGNYAGTSDSRFSEALKNLLGHDFYGAVPIHDRSE